MDIIHAPSFFCFCTCPLSQWLIRAAQGCKRAKQRLCAAEKRRALGRQDIRWPFPPTEGRPPGKLSPPQACCACPFSAHRRPVSKRLGAARPFRYAHEKNGFAVYAWARTFCPKEGTPEASRGKSKGHCGGIPTSSAAPLGKCSRLCWALFLFPSHFAMVRGGPCPFPHPHNTDLLSVSYAAPPLLSRIVFSF